MRVEIGLDSTPGDMALRVMTWVASSVGSAGPLGTLVFQQRRLTRESSGR